MARKAAIEHNRIYALGTYLSVYISTLLPPATTTAAAAVAVTAIALLLIGINSNI